MVAQGYVTLETTSELRVSEMGFDRGRADMQVRFIVPGSMVCNLDFVESIFGNGKGRGREGVVFVHCALSEVCCLVDCGHQEPPLSQS